MTWPGRSRRPLWWLLALALVAATTLLPAGAAGGDGAAGTYRNPVTQGVVDTFADPSVIRAKDGYWYAYGTTDAVRQFTGDNSRHYLPMMRSNDLVRWDYVGDVFAADARPSWHPEASLLFAPDIRYLEGKYYLYYSVAMPPRGPGKLFTVGVATAPSPAGPWTDSGGEVVERGSCDTDADIDPAQFTDIDGTHWLYWGSFDHLCVARLNDNATRTVGVVTPVYTGFAEGAFVVRHGRFNYLLVSESTCCNGSFSGYQIKVGRSTSPTGPFVDKEGLPLTAAHTKGSFVLAANGNRWVGTGHHSHATDLSGQDWLVYHALDRADPRLKPPFKAPRRPVLLDRLDWVDGWPTVRAGAGASDEPRPGPVMAPVAGSEFNDTDSLDGQWRRGGAAVGGWRLQREDQAGGYVAQHAPVAATSLLLSGTTAPADVRAEADLRLIEGTPTGEGAVGLVTGYQDAGNYVVAWLDRGRHALVTDVLVDGRSAGREGTDLPVGFDFSTWHVVALERRSRHLSVEVSDDRIDDPQAVQRRILPTGAAGDGSVGVAARHARVNADNVSAAALYSPVAATVPDPSPGTPLAAYGDEFDDGIPPGSRGDPQPWEWVRGEQGREAAGAFTWPTSGGELFRGTNTAPVLLRQAPAGDYTVETKLEFDGTRTPVQQAGLVLYADDDQFVKLVHSFPGGSDPDRTEFGAEGYEPGGVLSSGANFVGPPARTMWLRMVQRVDPVNGEHEVRAASSRDGRTWVWGATWTLPADTTPRIGLISQNSEGALAAFDYVRVYGP